MPSDNDNKSNIWEKLLKTPAFYGFVVTAVLLFVFLGVVLAVSGSQKYPEEERANASVARGEANGDDGSLLYPLSDAYRSFRDYRAKVENTPSNDRNVPTISPEPTSQPTEVISETTPPTQAPDAAANSVKDDGRDYYVFDIAEENVSFKKLKTGDKYVGGIGSDDGVSTLKVGGFGEGISLGNIFIENNYGADEFMLRDVFAKPLVVTRSDKVEWARVILFHTFSNQFYCVTESDRIIKRKPDLSLYSVLSNVTPQPSATPHPTAANSIFDVGIAVEKASEAKNVGIVESSVINDKVPDNAYATSDTLAALIARQCTTCELSVDLQRDVFEHPEGTRYKTVTTDNGKDYAQVKIIVAENHDESPNWQENLKFSIMLLERLEKKVPGISAGISLRPEAQYNTAATKFGLLIYIGYEGNLISEAENTAELLGETIAEIYLGE